MTDITKYLWICCVTYFDCLEGVYSLVNLPVSLKMCALSYDMIIGGKY